MMGYNTCPCCGKRTIERLGEYEICPICNWEDDPVQSADPHFSGGANSMSLEDAKKLYLSKKD
ncbi:MULTISPECIES: CPCC family cysteine-rich protein [Photorhabdus]